MTKKVREVDYENDEDSGKYKSTQERGLLTSTHTSITQGQDETGAADMDGTLTVASNGIVDADMDNESYMNMDDNDNEENGGINASMQGGVRSYGTLP